MPSEKILAAKQQRVEELVSELKGATTYVFVATRGLTVAQDTEMRSELRKARLSRTQFSDAFSQSLALKDLMTYSRALQQ